MQELPQRLAPKKEVIRALFARSGNNCFFPGCGEAMISEDGTFLGQVCHIEGVKGERFNPSMSNEERRSLGNLMLLCYKHHVLTDDQATYTVATLKAMKETRESNFKSSAVSALDFQNIYTEIRRCFPANELPAKRKYEISQTYIKRSLLSYHSYLEKRRETFHFGGDLTTLPDWIAGDKNRRLLLLSAAGYGKTSELTQLAAVYSGRQEDYFPVRIFLKDYDGGTISALLDLYLPGWQHIPEADLLLILDGLDEITPTHYATFINQLNTFAEARREVRMVVSARYNFYDPAAWPLRDFSTFVLQPFSTADVEHYLGAHLDNRVGNFRSKVQDAGCEDLLDHPFYLSEMVGVYNRDSHNFPVSKTGLLDRIVEDRFRREKTRKNLAIEKQEAFRLLSRVALVMTVMAKTQVSQEDLNILIPDADQRQEIRSLSIINREDNFKGSWSFEHKNIQELLAATVLQKAGIEKMKELMQYPYENGGIQPHYINTLSFLFSILPADETLFDQLLTWLKTKQPQLLIRFEKDKLSPEQRFQVFLKILEYYKGNDIGFYHSYYFHVSELASFVNLDDQLIDLLEKEISDVQNPGWMVYDLISLIGNAPKAYVFRKRLEPLLLSWIKCPGRAPVFYSCCIEALQQLKWNTEGNFRIILEHGNSLDDLKVRSVLVSFLLGTGFVDNHYQFLVESFSIFELKMSHLLIDESCSRLSKSLMQVRSPDAVAAVLDLMITYPGFLPIHGPSRALYADWESFAEFMKVAAANFKANPRILVRVYRLYRKYEHLPLASADWFTPFYEFFKNTCGTKVMFHKNYRYQRHAGDVIEFAGQKELDFLIDELRNGRMDEITFKGFRNMTYNCHPVLFPPFNEKLKDLFEGKFYLMPTVFNYKEHEQLYWQKNQLMLLDKTEFLKDVDSILTIVGEGPYEFGMFFHERSDELLGFRNSIGLEWLRNQAAKGKLKIKSDAHSLLSSDEYWESIRVKKIQLWLAAKDLPFNINSDLLDIARKWCARKIQETDFTGCVTQVDPSRTTYQLKHSFILDVYRYVQPDLPDTDLLKILEGDGQIYADKEPVAWRIAVDKIKDKVFLKKKILGNLEKNWANSILENHYKVCLQMEYKEALPYLFTAITENSMLDDWLKTKLTEIYLKLGGDIDDFKSFIQIPGSKADAFSSWNWVLIERQIPIDKSFVGELLLPLLGDDECSDEIRHQGAALLLRSGNVRGLRYWRDEVINKMVQPFPIYREPNLSGLGTDDNFIAEIDVLMETLIFAHQNNLADHIYDSVGSSCINCLGEIAKKGSNQLAYIDSKMSQAISTFKGQEIARQIAYQRERILEYNYKDAALNFNIHEALRSIGQIGDMHLL